MKLDAHTLAEWASWNESNRRSRLMYHIEQGRRETDTTLRKINVQPKLCTTTGCENTSSSSTGPCAPCREKQARYDVSSPSHQTHLGAGQRAR